MHAGNDDHVSIKVYMYRYIFKKTIVLCDFLMELESWIQT